MKTYLFGRLIAASVLTVVWLAFSPSSLFASGEVFVPHLQTTTTEYANVRVFNRNSTHLSFAHESGVAVIKLGDLTPDSLAALERAQAGMPEPAATVGSEATGEGLVLAQTSPAGQGRPLEAFSRSLANQLHGKSLFPAVSSQVIWGVLAALVCLYLFYCYCCRLICEKAATPGGLLVWLPGLQMIPLFRAAGMSGWWFLAMFVPVLNLVGPVLWCVKIAQVRGKGFLTALLLMLPVTNILAFLYLAFSSGHSQDPDDFVTVRPPHALALN